MTRKEGRNLSDMAAIRGPAMNMMHEKELHLHPAGVYPHVRRVPSPLCCFRIMHIRTGTIWIAYCEIMWIVSQLSFWTAESIVREAFPPPVIIIGFTFTILQGVFVGALIQGVRKFRISLIQAYMLAVIARILLYLIFLTIFVLCHFYPDFLQDTTFFRRFVEIKLSFLIIYTLLKVYALHVAHKCYSYISRTRRVLSTPSVVQTSPSKW
ncbi:unnamed protein product [Caenorhabditis auriculariae]|uniref:Uncharacterized protein n=1 Tax=Caenorhabditis auriculariae TaxID=2777116 RepID=A0A8S1HDP9_9PELO|nr:unnamed protein product [Caenorhabditis auriculariae]